MQIWGYPSSHPKNTHIINDDGTEIVKKTKNEYLIIDGIDIKLSDGTKKTIQTNNKLLIGTELYFITESTKDIKIYNQNAVITGTIDIADLKTIVKVDAEYLYIDNGSEIIKYDLSGKIVERLPRQ